MRGIRMALKVAVNGYGTIGKRVADAVARQPDMTLVGVTKTRPSFEARAALERGYRLFVAGEGRAEEFERAGLTVSGGVEDLLREADVVVDAAPDRIGAGNRVLYDRLGIPALFQGGEKPSVADHSFNALANYATCLGSRRLRVVSCNTTGIARAAALLSARYGIRRWEATLVRRAADPGESRKGPINGILPGLDFPSHHGPDVQTVLPALPIQTTALTVSTSLMHVHANLVQLERAPADLEELVRVFSGVARFKLFEPDDHVDGTPGIVEWARDLGRSRYDIMENVLWRQGIHLAGDEVRFFQAIHQESVVVPENVDALRAMFRLEEDPWRSMAITDRTLGLAPRRG